MGDIRIRVGVALDANVKSVYRPIVEAAQVASQQVMRALNTGHKMAVDGAAKEFARVPDAIAQPYRTGAKRAADELSATTRAAEREARAQARLVERQEREKERRYRAMTREVERQEREQTAIIDREAKKRSRIEDQERDRAARRTGYWAMRNFSPVTPTLSMGKRIMGDVARGAGVNFDAGSMVSDFVAREKLATQIANSAHIESGGLPSAKQKVDHKTLMSEANQTALATGGNASDVLQGMQSFVGKTGDLATARSIMADLAKLSAATGSSMGDMLDAAADVSNALGDVPNKGKVIYDTMRAIAGQGQVGAVEIKDMASNMSKLAAMTGSFKLEGSTSKILASAGLTDATSQNVAIMGAMAQAAKAHGGKPTATTSANASMAFVSDMTNRTTMKRWHEQGLDVFTDKSHTKVRDPKALILEALSKTKGDLGQISNLMPNKNSKAVLLGFKHDYDQGTEAAEATAKRTGVKLTDKDKNAAGLKATSDAFDAYLKVTMSNEEVGEKFGETMKTSSAHAAVFQTKLQMVADSSAERLLPALEKLAPQAERLAGAFSNFLVWATDHPGQAIATALSASIAKAGLENVLRTGIETMLRGASGAGGKPAGGVAGAIGGLGSVVTIAAMAVTTAQIGMAIIDKYADKDAARTTSNAAIGDSGTAFAVSQKGFATPEEKAQIQKELQDAQAKLESAKANPLGEGLGAWIANLGRGPEAAADAAVAAQKEQAQILQRQLDEIQKFTAVLSRIESKDIPMSGDVYGPPRPPRLAPTDTPVSQ